VNRILVEKVEDEAYIKLIIRDVLPGVKNHDALSRVNTACVHRGSVKVDF